MSATRRANVPRSGAAALSARPAKPAASLHPRNRHQGRYDFALLIAACPALAPFVAANPHGDLSIDFANPLAVKALNRALLLVHYGVRDWDIPAGYLCPPIPGRADYIHGLADLLGKGELGGGTIPTGPAVRVLDIGVGANCVYPLIGHAEYGWNFVGADVDRGALASAQAILEANPDFRAAIELRRQSAPDAIFRNIIRPGERFDLTLCNPPFHASPEDARRGSERKWRNLGKSPGPLRGNGSAPALNFGGRAAELWCPGGEAGFIARMIAESVAFGAQCAWFTTLVSKADTLPAIQRALAQVGARRRIVIPMTQGQKRSRVVAWGF